MSADAVDIDASRAGVPEQHTFTSKPPSIGGYATFPRDVFRIPLPNALFDEWMRTLSDAALQSLLALMRMAWHMQDKQWIARSTAFDRASIQARAGLSAAGTRKGLAELAEHDWVDIRESGQAYLYHLTIAPPTECYTYVPAGLLDAVAHTRSTSNLRVLLAVLRETWGWTHTCKNGDQTEVLHHLWTQCPLGRLATTTGRTVNTVRQATHDLMQGQFPCLHRYTPRGSTPYYRFSPLPFLDPPTAHNSTGAANTDPEGPPIYVLKTDFGKDTAGASTSKNTHAASRLEAPSDTERSMAKEMLHIGVRPAQVRECLHRYTPERIQRHIDYYHTESKTRTIKNPGGWLYAAIRDGYNVTTEPDASPKVLTHGDTYTEDERQHHMSNGTPPGHFHFWRCATPSDPPKYMYLAPDNP